MLVLCPKLTHYLSRILPTFSWSGRWDSFLLLDPMSLRLVRLFRLIIIFLGIVLIKGISKDPVGEALEAKEV